MLFVLFLRSGGERPLLKSIFRNFSQFGTIAVGLDLVSGYVVNGDCLSKAVSWKRSLLSGV
jgi:hypothetical protein